MKYKIIREFNGGIKNTFNSGTFTVFEMPITISKGILEALDEPTNLVVVSDAVTHIERLVFPICLVEGFTIEDIKNGVINCVKRNSFPIEGKMTMMINGGDIDTIEPYENYLDRLVELNV